ATAVLDLVPVARDCAASMRHVFAANRVELAFDPGDEPVWTSGDRDRLVQVIVNLLANAAKFSPAAGGRVKLGLRNDAEAVELYVSDNGPGIQPADRELVFERFRQVGDPLTDKPGGVGLGLAICRQIVTQHGGRIWVEDGPDGGALFRVRLPRARAGALAAAE
ncbi:MAG TPA: HAMP domain-containing sensor histidine kinase, partial [Bauldia sp.]|nr:HAMP domain-containing sensor histidine kinase [Bauldia sp.]